MKGVHALVMTGPLHPDLANHNANYDGAVVHVSSNVKVVHMMSHDSVVHRWVPTLT